MTKHGSHQRMEILVRRITLLPQEKRLIIFLFHCHQVMRAMMVSAKKILGETKTKVSQVTKR